MKSLVACYLNKKRLLLNVLLDSADCSNRTRQLLFWILEQSSLKDKLQLFVGSVLGAV